ncbi:heavy metal-binding domain-containing protein [candidate division KSB1 bacterium]|nr:heavy metal-binding domain-containing protein [candidate division KSB1 bacterium]
MMIVTTDSISDKKIKKTLGVVRGNTIRARHVGKDILAGLKNVFGGEIEEYTKLMAEAREQAIDRMTSSAEEMGANAVINVRFTTSFIMGAASEILAYGTAVIVE